MDKNYMVDKVLSIHVGMLVRMDVCVCENDRREIEMKAEITSAILNVQSLFLSADFMI